MEGVAVVVEVVVEAAVDVDDFSVCVAHLFLVCDVRIKLEYG